MINKKILGIIFAVLLCVSCIFLYIITSSREYTIDSPYEFTLTPKDEEWDNIKTKGEALSYCYIPDDILKDMTTAALVETVLEYPFITDYFSYNSYLEAARVFEREFNGFKELFKRKDATAALLDVYETSELATENTENKEFFRVSDIEFLIAYDRIKNPDWSGEEVEEFEKLLEDKERERDNSNLYSPASSTYLRFTEEAADLL